MGQLKTVVRQGRTFNMAVHLTSKQREFVRALVTLGDCPAAAARRAGYSHPAGTAYALMRLPHVQIAVRQERARLFDGDLANVAAGTLRTIMMDDTAPAAARVSAARTVLEVTREIGRRQEDTPEDRPLSEMSADELADLIERWKSERASMARDLDPGEVVVLDSAQDTAQLPREPAPNLP